MATVATLLTACKNNAQNKEAKTGEAAEIKKDSSEGAAKYSIVAEESKLDWQAYQVMKSGGHKGTVSISSGEFNVNNDQVSGGTFKIDLSTLAAVGMDDAAMKAKLEKHLKGSDFFDVEKYKDAEFTVAEVSKGNGDSSVVKGNLKIKDITNLIEFPALIKIADGKVTATASFSIDRKKWKLNYMSEKSFGDKMIKDMIDFNLSIAAKK